MPDRPSFPIPDNPTPDTYCLQIVMPNDPTWKAVIAGLLWQPAEWFNWQRNEEKTGKILAQYWREIFNNIDWSDMSCCCPETPPVQYKYIGTVLYRSTDGGVTFEPAPDYDYRNTSTQWPKPSEIGVPSTKCQAADSVVQTFRDQITQQITEDMGASAILGVIAAALLLFLSAGTTAAISAQVVAVVAAILGAGVTAWQAAFTTEVWDNFRCLIYNNMDSDESITQEGLDTLYEQLDTNFTGIVVPTLKGYIAAAGLVGINNMMASNSGDPDAICCTECSPEIWSITVLDGVPVGSIIGSGQNYITLQSVAHPSFGGLTGEVSINTTGSSDCCQIIDIEFITGETYADMIKFHVECGNPVYPASGLSPWDGSSSSNSFQIRKPTSLGSSQFQAKITFA